MQSKSNLLSLGFVVFLASFPVFLIQFFYSSLYFDSQIAPFLVFHNVAESFSIVISASIFGVGWFTYAQSKDKQALFLGTTFLAIALMDMMHMLAYSGMPDLFTENSPNKSTQFWIAVRFFAAISLLASSFLPNESDLLTSKMKFLILPLLVSISIFVLIIFFPDLVPTTFSPDTGLTPFKRIAEIVIICFLVLSSVAYWLRIEKYGWDSTKYFLFAFVFCIFSEVVFAVYTSVFDIYNVIGHIYKVIAFCLIYKGVFISSINRPYERLLYTNELLKDEVSERERARKNLAKSLSEKEALIREIYHRSNNTLQVISSLISLQSEIYPENQEIQTLAYKIQDRIQAISLVHRLLFSEQDLSSISLKRYVSDLTHYALQRNGTHSCKIETKIEIEDRKILIDLAIPIGLIISELLSNSVKHAFPNKASGTISISIAERQEGRLSLSYSDDGVGIPENLALENSNTLGMQLIYGIAEIQLSGKISLQKGPKFHCEIDFPMDMYGKRV
ncbi:MASE3 domain-containing protein [Leptospira perolatii]|uniref:MASE3 domain-containing protein n=1 Tax=Leptospira perolatii TaxID=2023191 RepID=UPI001FAEC04B|nr:MASE3 domain-containing protein [Leptospira perolatii]